METGTPVQYIREDGETEAAIVVKKHDDTRVDLLVVEGFTWVPRTSVTRGEESGHWRSL